MADSLSSTRASRDPWSNPINGFETLGETKAFAELFACRMDGRIPPSPATVVVGVGKRVSGWSGEAGEWLEWGSG